MISDHLSPADSACLALCNHYLLRCFEGTFSKNFSNGRSRTPSPTDDARIELLTRLSYNLPQYYLCNICLRLHLWRNVGLPNSSSPGFSHSPDDLDIHPDLNFKFGQYITGHLSASKYYSFNFVHLQLAMRRLYHGPEFGIPVESFLYTEVSAMKFRPKNVTESHMIMCLLPLPFKRVSEGLTRRNIMMTLVSAEARICSTPPGLCMRTQYMALVKRGNVPQLWTGYSNDLIIICNHITSYDTSFQSILSAQLYRYCLAENTHFVTNEGRCDYCNTCWHLQLASVGRNQASMTLTLWMDFGPGLSDEDFDWKYRGLWGTPPLPEHMSVDARRRFEEDSIQARAPNAVSMRERYWRNVALIRGKRYQELMTDRGDGIYVLHEEPGEPKAKARSSCCIIL